MVTLNPFQIYENVTKVSDLAEFLPEYSAKIEGERAGAIELKNTALRRLGKILVGCYKNDGSFNELYETLKVCEEKANANIKINNKIKLPSLSENWKNITKNANDISFGLTNGIAAGGAAEVFLAFGAYSLAGAFGTASTGTAISALSGAAASNATLAWLGGGTLAAGGLGVTGGMLAIGGLVALPVFLFTGISTSAKTDKLLAEGMTKLEELKKVDKQVQIEIEQFQEITKVANLLRKILGRCDKLANRFIDALNEMKDSSNPDLVLFENALAFYDLINKLSALKIINNASKIETDDYDKLNNIGNELKKWENNYGSI